MLHYLEKEFLAMKLLRYFPVMLLLLMLSLPSYGQIFGKHKDKEAPAAESDTPPELTA